SRRAGAHTVLTAMAFGDQGFRPESALLSSTILDFVENRLHKILRPAAVFSISPETYTLLLSSNRFLDFH
ncbi:hypothetical protein, partial [Dysosmobacter sp.]|uniref:hypothetical protein n=1 Tax=Dysosmobacter sp. TaxID=2591382 RepID=UPI002A818E7B